MTVPLVELLTVDDLGRSPDDDLRRELIDGVLHLLSRPTPRFR